MDETRANFVVMLFLNIRGSEIYFLQFKTLGSDQWAIPRRRLLKGDDPLGESLPKIFFIQSLTNWDIPQTVNQEDVVELHAIATSICVVVVGGDAPIPQNLMESVRWTSFLSTMNPRLSEELSAVDTEILESWLRSQEFVEITKIKLI